MSQDALVPVARNLVRSIRDALRRPGVHWELVAFSRHCFWQAVNAPPWAGYR